MKLIDLSHLIENSMPVYPGDIKSLVQPLSSIEENGATVSKLILSTHTGTHADAPKHMLKRGQAVHEIPLKNFVGDAWVFDFSYKTRGTGIVKDDLENKTHVHPDDIVLFYTGSSEISENEGSDTRYVYISKSAADWLVRKKVKAIGIDSLSVERFGSRDYDVHKTLLRNGINIIENLSSNLKFLTGKRVFFIGVPLKLREADGSPIRAFAVIW
jgi:kynurenine formamidase